jgi:hypothetical protein
MEAKEIEMEEKAVKEIRIACLQFHSKISFGL